MDHCLRVLRVEGTGTRASSRDEAPVSGLFSMLKSSFLIEPPIVLELTSDESWRRSLNEDDAYDPTDLTTLHSFSVNCADADTGAGGGKHRTPVDK